MATRCSDEDRRRILSAVRVAKRRNPAMSASFFDFIASVLLLEDPDGLSDEDRARAAAVRAQVPAGHRSGDGQGLEDTAFYRYYPLASLNEVGGEPATSRHVGRALSSPHRRSRTRAWPHTMLATGTHDTKRGEDMRARLNVLSEMPEEWEAALGRWQALNAAATHRARRRAGARRQRRVPDLPDAGRHLAARRRLDQAERGRLRRAHRAVPGQGAARGQAAHQLAEPVRRIRPGRGRLHPRDPGRSRARRSCSDLDSFVRSIADAGFVNSLAQTLVKMCAPGVPDFYQGVEFWDFNLVDPDNRRPVDFARAAARRSACLDAQAKRTSPGSPRELLADWPDERIKMFVIWQALAIASPVRPSCSMATT